jgi:2'-5' RNA ligase
MKTVQIKVALPLPTAFQESLREALYPIRKENSEYRWLLDNDLYITICFFREAGDMYTHYVQDAVGNCAAGFGPIKVNSPGLFRNWRANKRYRSKWSGLFGICLRFSEGKSRLTKLADMIDDNLNRLSAVSGYTFRDRVERPFVPYVLLVHRGRPRNPVVLKKNSQFWADLKFARPIEGELTEAAAYMSIIDATGTVLKAAKVFKL